MRRINGSFIGTVSIFVLLLTGISTTVSGASISGLAANPVAFNSNTGNTDIEYTLVDVTNGSVLLEIYDSGNNIVRTIDGGIQGSGTHSILWDGKNDNGLAVLEGIYTAKLSVSVGSGDSYQFVLKWGSYGSGNGQFYHPYDVDFDSGGNVYVADSYNHRMQKFDSVGNFILKWGSYGTGNGQFNYSRGVAVDSTGNIYVTDNWNHRMQKFDSVGSFILKWGSYGTGNGQFHDPISVAVDSIGNVSVADRYNHRIQRFDSNGNFILKWGSYGTGNGQFNSPMGVGIDSSGNVYVAEWGNHRIQKFDSNGDFITKWGNYGGGDGQFNSPYEVAVDSSGNVYVADYWNHRIQKFDSNGNFITKWGSYGSGNGQFKYPTGVGIDSSGNVYVADTSNHRIQKFAPQSVRISAETGVTVDNTPPEISITAPVDEIEYILGQPVLADWSAADALSGIASAAGTVRNGEPIDTGSAEIKEFTVSAEDYAGNESSRTVTYSVLYNNGGILSPIKDNRKGYNLGSAIPVKIQLWDYYGNPVTDAVLKLYLVEVDGNGGEIEAVSTSKAAEGNLFRYDGTDNQYIFNLDTKALSSGTWRLGIYFNYSSGGGQFWASLNADGTIYLWRR